MFLLRCIIFGHKWDVIRQEWISPTDSSDHISLLQFTRCTVCADTKATITHPHNCKSAYSHPGPMHKWDADDIKNHGHMVAVAPEL